METAILLFSLRHFTWMHMFKSQVSELFMDSEQTELFPERWKMVVKTLCLIYLCPFHLWSREFSSVVTLLETFK